MSLLYDSYIGVPSGLARGIKAWQKTASLYMGNHAVLRGDNNKIRTLINEVASYATRSQVNKLELNAARVRLETAFKDAKSHLAGIRNAERLK